MATVAESLPFRVSGTRSFGRMMAAAITDRPKSSVLTLHGRQHPGRTARYDSTRVGVPVIALVAIAALTGCGDGDPVVPESTPEEASVTSVEVTPAEVTLGASGDTARLRAVAMTVAGDTLETAPDAFRWSSSDTTVVNVDSGGTLTAVVQGTASVSAALEGEEDTAEVTVTGSGDTESSDQYERIDLAERAGLSGTSEAVDVNSEGRVLIAHREVERVVVWDSERGIVATLNAPGDSIRPAAINDLGQVVGGMDTERGEWRGFFWDSDSGELAQLPTFGDGTWSEATDLSDRGQVVGNADTVMTLGGTRPWTEPFVWEVGEEHLRHLGRLRSDAAGARATGISSLGQVAGNRNNIGGSWKVFRWTEEDGMVQIGGHNVSPATAINDGGKIVGYTDAPGPGYWAPFIWDGSTWRVLDRFEEQATKFFDINNDGTAVGATGEETNENDVESEIVLWDEAEGYRLLTSTGRPHAINDRGLVVGWYTSDDERHAALWEPPGARR